MSMDKKLREAASLAAIDATNTERGRILWLFDESERELEAGFNKKLLIESERHAAEVKMQIAKALFSQIKIRIASGVRPCERCKRPVMGVRRLCEECLRSDAQPN